jgi:hypothetical protein
MVETAQSGTQFVAGSFGGGPYFNFAAYKQTVSGQTLQ